MKKGTERDEAGLGGDGGLFFPRTQTAGEPRAGAHFYFAWGCFRDFVSGPSGTSPIVEYAGGGAVSGRSLVLLMPGGRFRHQLHAPHKEGPVLGRQRRKQLFL